MNTSCSNLKYGQMKIFIFFHRSVLSPLNNLKACMMSSTLLIETLFRHWFRHLGRGHSSPVPRFFQRNQCRESDAGIPRGHKFVSMKTKALFAIWDTVGLHRAWYQRAWDLYCSGLNRSQHCLYIPHFSWSILNHTFWSIQTTHPRPTVAPQKDE